MPRPATVHVYCIRVSAVPWKVAQSTVTLPPGANIGTTSEELWLRARLCARVERAKEGAKVTVTLKSPGGSKSMAENAQQQPSARSKQRARLNAGDASAPTHYSVSGASATGAPARAAAKVGIDVCVMTYSWHPVDPRVHGNRPAVYLCDIFRRCTSYSILATAPVRYTVCAAYHLLGSTTVHLVESINTAELHQ
ncbi:hypothetical protein HPB51_012455 [Rhipicephalus microplus]|uniref:Uncharacterized protein n=1 Tax=Rhipicephalus microplus TaxID=6941 RepID=A0A9J6E8V9_RHIMP|nr:hypothetical protein HPB51_012455 [Rhipicephalus microplus]